MQREQTADEDVAEVELMDDVDVPPCNPLFKNQWSCIPINCILAPSDVKPESKGKQYSCKFIAPRQSYLFLHLDSITQHLAPHTEGTGNVWFTWEPKGASTEQFVPLHFPLSVVFDYLYSWDRTAKDDLIPLELIVHFKKPNKDAEKPEEKKLWEKFGTKFNSTILVHDRESAYLSYVQLLKQALVVKFDRCFDSTPTSYGKVFSQMFGAVNNNNSAEFWALRYKLLSVGERTSETKDVPIWIHHKDKSKLIRAKPSGEKLGTFLKENVNLPFFRCLTVNQCHSTKELAHVTIQGLQPVNGTPLDQLVELFSSADLCLHIVVTSP